MILFKPFLKILFLAFALVVIATPPRGGKLVMPRSDDGLQDIVTWDKYSIFINGVRTRIISGEFHPYRLPAQSLYLDVFQKIKSMGFNSVSFYVFWGLLEPKKGEISFEGFRDLQPFIDAAKAAGIYLIARPGPYINAEVAAGGFPGWSFYAPGIWRTSNTTFFDDWQGYMSAVGKIISDNEITKGGPIILVQAENEYSGWESGLSEDFTYESQLLKAIRAAGITVPVTFNDAWAGGHFLSVDIYGYDSYPQGFDCDNPYTWSSTAVSDSYWASHESLTPNVPHSLYEFQGGAFDPWGGAGYNACAILTGTEFERVFYKNDYAQAITTLNLYMIYGGTNWGGIAEPSVYTSYDYGSAIAEDRTLREKYYELKLQANFLQVSPAFLTTTPQNVQSSAGSFTGNSALRTTQTLDTVGNKTGFYIIRAADPSSTASISYTIQLPTSIGNLTIPAIGGELTLQGRDSKVFVVDYSFGTNELLYSTAEIVTWATINGKDVLIVYGNAGELHETAFTFNVAVPNATVVSGSGTIQQKVLNSTQLVLQYNTTGQTVVNVGSNILLYILDRAEAYQFWVLHPPSSNGSLYSTDNPIIVKGGYLLRNATVSGDTLALRGDLNATANFEIVGSSTSLSSVTFNGVNLSLSHTSYGTITSSQTVSLPSISVPNLATSNWKVADSLPEIQPNYSDTIWTLANHTTTSNPTPPNTTVVLYPGEYGYHTGNQLFRAHFNATGLETGFSCTVWGGTGFGYSVWLDSTFLGSWVGDPATESSSNSFNFNTSLSSGSGHVITILQDHMGYDEDWTVSDGQKTPRGISAYSFLGSTSTNVSAWKLTGNLGGESYVDTTRGPLNEGGLFGERQGWHLPGFQDSQWASGSPITGISTAGVRLYRTTFTLNVPAGVDYPMSIVTSVADVNSHFRAQIYVNGYQFGKYVNHLGPQHSFPVPEGILNYHGQNTLAISLWAMDSSGAKLASLALEVTAKVASSMAPVANQPMPAWSSRVGAY